jgi:hypothetical protein
MEMQTYYFDKVCTRNALASLPLDKNQISQAALFQYIILRVTHGYITSKTAYRLSVFRNGSRA